MKYNIDKIREIVSEKINNDEIMVGIYDEFSLVELGCDSFCFITIIIEIEKTFLISIDESKTREIHTIKDLDKIIKELLKKSNNK